MWELICDHKYLWGTIAADRSPWRSDGIPSGIKPAPGDTGVRFSGPQSRITIPRKASGPWLELRGLKVEITLRLDTPHGILIEGDQSFRMGLGAYGTLMGDCAGESINSVTHWVGSGLQSVSAASEWARLTFEHNGFNRMQLFIDDTLVARRSTISTVPGVGAQGISIGNTIGTGGSDYLHGDIEAVRVWRIDPRSMEREFLARPLDPAVADCWAKFIRAFNEALRSNPECARWLHNAIAGLHEKFVRSLAQKDQAKIDQFDQMCTEYRALWRAGLVDSPQMTSLAARFRGWIIAEGLVDPDDPVFRQIVEDRCFQLILSQLPPMTCDPQLEALIRAFAGGYGSSPRPATFTEILKCLLRRLTRSG